MAKIKNKSNSSRSPKKIIALAGMVIVYLGLAFLLKFWPFHKHVTITATSVKNSLPTSNATGTKSNSTSQTVNDSPKVPTQIETNTKTLEPPSGTFANLYTADANTQMNSICHTSPGANCQIVFTKGSLSIALPLKTSDSSGTATWAWTPQQIGLTSGKWHIVAKATLGSQTKTTDNGPLELVIQ